MARWCVGIAIAAAAIGGCGSRKDSARGALGTATGAALRAAVEAAAAATEPWRCARLDEPVAVTAPAGWTLDGKRLRRSEDGERGGATAVRFAVIGEARGGGAATVAALDGLRRALDAEPVDVVVTFGGMGASRQEIAAAIGPVAAGASWLVIAVPGDREAIAEHRAAIAELAAGGANVVDGSQVRLVEVGGVVLGTLPGAAERGRLGAGVAGCVHDDADAAAVLAALAPGDADGDADKAGKAPLTVLVTQQAPRGATDLAPGGVHAGDRGLAAQLAAHPVDLVAHGAVDDASAPAGKVKRGVAAVVAVGAIDATRRYRDDGTAVRPSSMVFIAGARELAWKPLSPRVLP